MEMKVNLTFIIMIGALIGLSYHWLTISIDNYWVSIIVYMTILMTTYILMDMRYKVIKK